MSRITEKGYDARMAGWELDNNPYDPNLEYEKHQLWRSGFIAANGVCEREFIAIKQRRKRRGY